MRSFDTEHHGREEIVAMIGKTIRMAEVGTSNGYSLLVLTLNDGSVLEVEEQSQTGYFSTQYRAVCESFDYCPY